MLNLGKKFIKFFLTNPKIGIQYILKDKFNIIWKEEANYIIIGY